jgi:hypothetical protein
MHMTKTRLAFRNFAKAHKRNTRYTKIKINIQETKERGGAENDNYDQKHPKIMFLSYPYLSRRDKKTL